MEYVKNGSLLSLLSKNKTLEMSKYWRYTRDIVSGLLYRKFDPSPPITYMGSPRVRANHA
jgi:hypothetical protein